MIDFAVTDNEVTINWLQLINGAVTYDGATEWVNEGVNKWETVSGWVGASVGVGRVS